MIRDTHPTHQEPIPPAPSLIEQLRTQRSRIATLSRETGSLQWRGVRLLEDSLSLAERIERSRAGLAEALLMTKSAVAELRLRRLQSRTSTPVPKAKSSLVDRALADSPDIVEALEQATEILKMQFLGTEGSGRETLAICEKVLRRARSICTIELPLY